MKNFVMFTGFFVCLVATGAVAQDSTSSAAASVATGAVAQDSTSSAAASTSTGKFTPSPNFAQIRYTWGDLKKCCPVPDLLTTSSRAACRNQSKEEAKSAAGTTVDPAAAEEQEGEDGGAKKSLKRERECFAECNFKELGLLGSDGKVSPDLVEKHAKSVEEKMPEWKDIITAAVKNCSSQVPTTYKLGKKCTSGASELKSCVSNQLSINCPASVKVESQQCTDILAKKAQVTVKKTERAMKRLLG